MGVLGSLPEEDPAPHAPTKSAQALIIIFVFNGLTPEGIQHENENCKSWTIFRIRVMGILRYLTAQSKYNQSRWVGVFDGSGEYFLRLGYSQQEVVGASFFSVTNSEELREELANKGWRKVNAP